MRVQYEKERKAKGKGGRIVESRPSFLSVRFAGKSVALHTCHLPSSPLIPLFSKHASARCNASLLQQSMHIKPANTPPVFFSHRQRTRITPSHSCSLFQLKNPARLVRPTSRAHWGTVPPQCAFSPFSANASQHQVSSVLFQQTSQLTRRKKANKATFLNA